MSSSSRRYYSTTGGRTPPVESPPRTLHYNSTPNSVAPMSSRSATNMASGGMSNRILSSTYPRVSRTRPSRLRSSSAARGGGGGLDMSLPFDEDDIDNNDSLVDEEAARFDERSDQLLSVGHLRDEECPKCKRYLDFATKVQIENKELKEDLEDKEENLARLAQKHHADREKDRERRKAKTQALTDELQKVSSTLEEEVARFSKRLKETQTNHDAEISLLKQENSRLKSDVEDAKAQLDTVRLRHDEMKMKSQEFQLRLEVETEKTSRLTEDLTRARQSHDTSIREIQRLQDELMKREHACEHLERLAATRQTEFDARIEDLRLKHNVALKDAAQRLEEEKQSSSTEPDLRQTLDDAMKKIHALEAEVEAEKMKAQQAMVNEKLALEIEFQSRYANHAKELEAQFQAKTDEMIVADAREKDRVRALEQQLDKLQSTISRVPQTTLEPIKRSWSSFLLSATRLLFLMSLLVICAYALALVVLVKSPNKLHYSPAQELSYIARDFVMKWMGVVSLGAPVS